MKNQLKQVLKCISSFTDDELDRILSCFTTITAKKNSLLLHEGTICKQFYFVYNGCVRSFFIDRKGHEKTRLIMLDNHIGTAFKSFVSQTPSVEFLEALEHTELLSISYSDFYTLNNELESWKIFYQRILEMAYVFQNKKIEQLLTLSATQRYETVVDENPTIIQRVSNKVLASYLDIREETLSRLKSK